MRCAKLTATASSASLSARGSELAFARERIAPEADSDVETCRTILRTRIERCEMECDTCRAECTNSEAESLVSAYRCSLGLPVLGMAAAFHSSDIGVDIASRYGAIRTQGRPPTPNTAFQEQYRTMIQNSVSSPVAPRNSISCRKSHAESSVGGYTAPLKDDGKVVQRVGYMVGCETDSDCFSRCGTHPIHGSHYVCTHNLTLYTYAGYDGDTAKNYKASETVALASGAQHAKVTVDAKDANFYFLDEPGDDRFDIGNHSKGVCTDVHVSYGSTGCQDVAGAKLTMGITGCTGRMFGWATLFCGTQIVHEDSDFVSGVGIARSSLPYPRILVPETEVNGQTELAITCSDGFDCQTKCDFFGRVARDGGLPAPAACSLCAPPCPDNIGTSTIQFVHGLAADIATALRLAALCLGPSSLQACVCQIFMMLKPAWVSNLDPPTENCKGGDVFLLIAERIELLFLEDIEATINFFVVPWLSSALSWLGVKLDPICVSNDRLRKYCPNDPKQLQALLGCEVGASREPHKRCFYE